MYKYILFLFLFPSIIFSQNADCINAEQICSNADRSTNPSGIGVQELNNSNRGCINSNEVSSAWYILNVGTGGNLNLIIDPSGNTDYDFAIWGPNLTCGNLGVPIRCSYAAPANVRICAGINNNTRYNTGISTGEPDISESAGNSCTPIVNGFVNTLPVLSGQTYILLVNNYSDNDRNFNLSFATSTAILNCTPLPVFFQNIIGKFDNNEIKITLNISQEYNNIKEYEIFIMNNNNTWEYVTFIKATNNNVYEKYISRYVFGSNLYKIVAKDYDGTLLESNIFEVIVNNENLCRAYPNPTKKIKFECNDNDIIIEIISAIGKIQYFGKIQEIELNSGLYYIKYIKNSTIINTEKIIIY